MRIEVDLFGTNPNNINDITWDTVCATDVAAMDKIGVRNIGVKYYLGNMNYYTHSNNTHWGNMIMINASGGYIYYTMISYTDSTVRNYPSTNVNDAYVHKTPAYYRGVIRLKPTARLDGSFSIPISDYKPIGDYVDYDAGEWTKEDLQLIRDSEGNPTVNNNTELPSGHAEFGGFTEGQSRNSNSTPFKYTYSGVEYGTPYTSGWRIWDIDNDTGEITLIHAGYSETYCNNADDAKSRNILKNRNCKMYENEYAKEKSAHILNGEETAEWYNKHYGTNYNIVENGGTSTSTFYGKIFSKIEPISVLQNGSWYYIATRSDDNKIYNINPYNCACYDYNGNGGGLRYTYSCYPKTRSTNRQN